MFIFVLGLIIGLVLWIGGSWFDSADRWVRPAAVFARSLGSALAVSSVGVAVVYTRLDRTGVRAVRGRALRVMIATLSLLVPLGVGLKLVPRWSGIGVPVVEVMMAVWVLPFVVWRAFGPSWHTYTRVMKHPNDYCHGCGYRLLPEQERCPECGWDVARRTEK